MAVRKSRGRKRPQPKKRSSIRKSSKPKRSGELHRKDYSFSSSGILTILNARLRKKLEKWVGDGKAPYPRITILWPEKDVVERIVKNRKITFYDRALLKQVRKRIKRARVEVKDRRIRLRPRHDDPGHLNTMCPCDIGP